MKLLLHVCCGPCTIYPLTVLRNQDIEVTGHFYNPNIHPYKEFSRRLETLQNFANLQDLPLVVDNKYGLTEFIRKVVFHEKERCDICYAMRLEKCAVLARESGYDFFSTTLLYSRFQRHKGLVALGNQLAEAYGVAFYYQDFRQGWQYGIDRSIELEMYRQPYCGCIYSEQERYDKSLSKK